MLTRYKKLKETVEGKGKQYKWPFSQYISDVLRASFTCKTAESFFCTYQRIIESENFEVVRVKNKIGLAEGPFNIHLNLLFRPTQCQQPILCEVQIFPTAVFELQHRQHLMYQLKRAKGVGEFNENLRAKKRAAWALF